jgi:PleD family two-component response regulator
VTVSIGAAERRGRQELPGEVIRAADKALYRAKDGGRNRVER